MRLRTRIIAGAAGAIASACAIVLPFEGRNLVAYLDPVGIPTICDGWTRGVHLGDVATHAQCDELTLQALEEARDVFDRWVPSNVRGQLSDDTTGAFLSFIYNVGPGAPGVKSGFVYLHGGGYSTLLRRLRAGRVAEACAELPRWIYADGRRLRGLERRRAAERAICEAGL